MGRREDIGQGQEVHMARSISGGGIVYCVCGYVCANGKFSILWEHVTCANCKRSEPKEEDRGVTESE